MRKITHVITGLGNGGAESMLYKLLLETDYSKYEVNVISLTGNQYYKEKIEQLGVKVYLLNLKSSKFFFEIKKLISLCKEADVIQSWMYHANILSYVVAKLLKKKLAWGIHHSNLSKGKNKQTTILIAKLGARLSPKVDKVISCGEEVRDVHLKIGYDHKNHKVIFNGFDTEKFNVGLKREYYKQFSELKADDDVILHVGRWDPLKDYNNLLNGIKILKEKRENFKVFLVGNRLDNFNEDLITLIETLNLTDDIVLLGQRDDIPQLMAGANVFVLSSVGEGLPNVLGEAMLSGTCCVTTNVGDCKAIVREYGEIVPSQNSKELALAIEKVLNYSEELYKEKSHNGRLYVMENYDIRNVSNEYFKIYDEL
ncbi:MAG: glycosyltransferase [Solibacillus sp.]